MSDKNEELMLALARITFLSLSEKIYLLKNLDSNRELALLSIEDISRLCDRHIRVKTWNGMENMLYAEREKKILEAKNICHVMYENPEYPALLKEAPDAPFVLFYRGNLDCLYGKTVSVVGARSISVDSKEAAKKFANDAAFDDCTVVSGLAFGADAAAHTGSVNAFFDALTEGKDVPSGKTVAVLPVGIDTVWPKTHFRLAENIIKSGGCLLSEYVPGCIAASWRFVHRNRIIAALSPATVVIQAASGSGSLITAKFALDYGRDVMFHKQGFSETSVMINRSVEEDLHKKLNLGEISASKLENSPKKYLEAGAPVIEDYDDYCRCLWEFPGQRNCKLNGGGQLELPV